MASDRAIFREPGWEERCRDSGIEDAICCAVEFFEPTPDVEKSIYALERREAAERKRQSDSMARSKRRAKAAVFDLALSNELRFFVTLTLAKDKVNRYDIREVTKRLNTWLDNHVRRDGLKYVLVAERHKDGAVHFHGFFNDVLDAVDSGTMVPPGGGKPKRPRSKAQRAAWAAAGGRVVYNLPAWDFGFTTAMEVYGKRSAAVGYVCKYITKADEKVGGRWYYSGGKLARPSVEYCAADFESICSREGAVSFSIDTLNCRVVKLFLEGGGADTTIVL